MQTSQITIQDYNILTTLGGKCWAKASLFGHEVEFYFSTYDAITAAIELGHMSEPDDRDEMRVGYEKPMFSATCRESFDYAKRIQYQTNTQALREFSGTQFAEDIVRRLALQAPEVRQVIQAEALSEVMRNGGVAVEVEEVKRHLETVFEKEVVSAIDMEILSDQIKQLWYAAEQ